MGINAGDIITVIGPKTSYNGNPQLKDVTVEDHKAVTDATLSEFIAAEVADDVWYRLTGTVDNIYNTEYAISTCLTMPATMWSSMVSLQDGAALPRSSLLSESRRVT